MVVTTSRFVTQSTPSILQCPVVVMMSCSSTPLWKSLVALVTQSEWYVLKPWTPAALHKCFTVSSPYHTKGLLSHVGFSMEPSRRHLFCTTAGQWQWYFLYKWTKHLEELDVLEWCTTRFGSTLPLCQSTAIIYGKVLGVNQVRRSVSWFNKLNLKVVKHNPQRYTMVSRSICGVWQLVDPSRTFSSEMAMSSENKQTKNPLENYLFTLPNP